MFSFKKDKKPVVNIVMEDYAIRVLINQGNELDSVRTPIEQALPSGVIADGKIRDEAALLEMLHDMVDTYRLKGMPLRFYVPNALIIMRHLEIPKNVIDEEINQYITMEIGHTIHFPFTNPLFDIYNIEELEETKRVTVFAAPEEDVLQYMDLFAEAKLKPAQADVEALGCYRYFYTRQEKQEQSRVYLLLELNLTSTNVSIFHQHFIEFLRYQPINIEMKDWEFGGANEAGWHFTGNKGELDGHIGDQLNELASIMNFYQFSIHQGNQAVSDIVLFGDMPDLPSILEALEDRFTIPIHVISPYEKPADESLSSAFIPVLGLALKGGSA